ALPRSPLAFHNRTVLTLSPTQIHGLTIHRDGTDYELVSPAGAGTSTHWRMMRPVAARADEEAITKATLLLSSLRAEEYISDQVGDGKAFGLYAPSLSVTWTMPAESVPSKPNVDGKAKTAKGKRENKSGTLRIGGKLPKSELWYANIEGNPA